MTDLSKDLRVNIPTIDELTERANRLRKDAEEVALRLGRTARGYLPEQGQRGVDTVIDQVSSVSDDISGRVDDLRDDIQGRISGLRKDVDSQVKSLRKQVESRRKKAVTAVERGTRKQVEVIFKRISLPVRGDIDAIKRRMTRIERKLDQVIEGKKAA